VVFEFGELQFVGVEVERVLENAEGFLFVEHPHSEEVTDLEDEAAGFLEQRCLGVAYVLPEDDDLLLTGKMGLQIPNGLFQVLGKLGECASELVGSLKSVVQHHVVNREGKKGVGLASKVS